ncbi:hypothetical protein THIOM_003890 [Candidatus Thiomargarita nelsonii]|uniref:Uncharacterized protein n=1 Tax=Candidatus Thiomargarita nelsonii TaxID=1003181 RepID=A0A176RXB5_9GAMM|nr:hypothetical protein THIOM_003890 [Candidatus Thiomargarita nelsonii]
MSTNKVPRRSCCNTANESADCKSKYACNVLKSRLWACAPHIAQRRKPPKVSCPSKISRRFNIGRKPRDALADNWWTKPR